jgi:N-acyl-D-aspartate/D-glutamate deacylase
VTTVMGGNCGFTIAPLTPEDGDYLMRMLARVEGMPLESLQQGVPWDWRTTAEYLDRIDGTLMPNAGFMVGHSAIRRVVMKDQATERAATPDEIRMMQQLLRDGLAAGGMGFSSTWSTSHNDHTGVPVPSRHATAEEVIALCGVVKDFPGTTLEFIPQVGSFSDESFNLMAAMSVAANRPLNWNLLQVQEQNWTQVQHQLTGGDIAKAAGGRVLALTLPDTFRLRLNLRSGFVLDILPGWDKLMALAPEAKLAMLRDPAGRAEMDRLAQTSPNLRMLANWGNYTLLETFTERWKPFEGRTLQDIATEIGTKPWDLLAEIAIDDDLNTVIASMDSGQSDASWERRVEVWRDPRAIVGASDAGAHLDMIDSFSYATTLLARTTVERSLLPLEEAVHYLTGAQSALYGLTGRGTIALSHAADLVIFDPTRIGPGEVYTKFDLPGGSGRVYGESVGIEHVLVNGVPCVQAGELLDARPGTLLRSGRDTHTVTAQ